MPRIYSAALLAEKNRLVSDHPFALLFELDIAGAPAPFRLAAYDQDIFFHGEPYFRFPCDVDALEDPTHAALVNLRVTTSNVDQQMISLLEQYWATTASPQWSVAIYQIDCMQPDQTPFGSADIFSVQQVSTDLLNATFDLVAEGVTLTAVVPKRRYTVSSGFRHIPMKQ